ncbi:MAG: glycosyltransferase [Anaerolineae bacterium]|nr:glycosyltransferase [Anaerolineae bacterium]
MRVALVGPVYPYRGGIAHYTTMLNDELRRQGHEVLLVSFNRQYPRWLFPGASDRDPSQMILHAEGAHYWIDSINPATWLYAFLKIAQYRPDIVVLQWWTTFWSLVWLTLGLLTRCVLRKPLVFICHNVLPHETRWWEPLLTSLVLNFGTGFVVQSSQEHTSLLRIIPKARDAIVPTPIYAMFSDCTWSQEQARSHLGLECDANVLLFFGIVRPYKGLEDLLYALPQICQQLGKTRLIVAGEIWGDTRSYTDLVHELGLEPVVSFEDRYIPNEEIGMYFAAADVLVAPYRHVTGSAVLQMGIGFGCPIITTRVGDAAKLAEGNPAIQLVEPGNRQELVQTIVQYFTQHSDSQQERKMGKDISFTTWADLVRTIEELSGQCA